MRKTKATPPYRYERRPGVDPNLPDSIENYVFYFHTDEEAAAWKKETEDDFLKWIGDQDREEPE